MRGKNKNGKKLTKHHIIPRSRGGKTEPNNLLRVDEKKHEAYHLLFNNMLQHEIIEYLINFWFKGKITFETKRLFLKLLLKETKRKKKRR